MSGLDEVASKADIARLERFQQIIRSGEGRTNPDVRSRVTRESSWVRRKVLEYGCLKLYTIGPPPAVGGLIMENVDMFSYIFDPPYLRSVVPQICDMIDQTIAAMLDPPAEKISANTAHNSEVRVGYAFVAMAIDDSNSSLVDTLDAIKEACKRCGVVAERIDEDVSNDRITDRMLAAIDSAEFVIADLTLERPNVFYEAGYSLGKGKVPIYIAKMGTKLHFDLKDYPVIFFDSYKSLKNDLEKRLRGIAMREIE